MILSYSIKEVSLHEKNPGGKHPSNSFQKARVSAGVSQETAAETLGCSTRTLQRYVEKGCDPPISVIRRMMSLYKFEFADLYPDTPDEKPPPLKKNIFSQTECYRLPMPVTSVRYYPACPELSTYPLCPRCDLPMEREYLRFCVHCGQALDWKVFSKALIILARFPYGSR